MENQTKVILQMQSLLRHNSLSSDLGVSTPDPSSVGEPKGRRTEEQSREGLKKEGESTEIKEKPSHLTSSGSTSPARWDISDWLCSSFHLSHLLTALHLRLPPRFPLRLLDRLDSLVQSQARELSQLRQQVKESRKLGALQRRQLEDLNQAFKELLQANKVDCYMGEVVKEQLDKSLGLLDRLEGRLDRGSCCGQTQKKHAIF